MKETEGDVEEEERSKETEGGGGRKKESNSWVLGDKDGER